MQPILILIRPLDIVTATRIDIRLGDSASADDYGAGGFVWEPAITTRPKMSIELFSLDMDGKVQTGRAQFEAALGNITAHADPASLYWRGAAVTIWRGHPLEGANAVPAFQGYITDPTVDRDSGKLSISAEVSDIMIDKPLLTLTFEGGGDLSGDADKRGVYLPAGFGTVKNIEPVWFDLTRNIGMIDGYGNTISIDWLGEGLNSLGARVADYPNYAALAAAIDDGTVAPGRWASCIAQGLVGLGAPPFKPITVHATFGFGLTGALIGRILSHHLALVPGVVDQPALDALDAAVPYPVHYWTGEQRNAKDLIQALARACNASPLITFQGKVSVTRAVAGQPALTLDRDGGSSPRVLSWRPGTVQPPYYQIRARTARPARVMSFDEVNYVDTIEDKGRWKVDETYRAGNLVWLANGSQWLYTNATSSKGNPPPAPPLTANAFWEQIQPPKVASDFTYDDGTTLEELKPAEPGATDGATLGTGVDDPGNIKNSEGSPLLDTDLETSKGTSADTAKVAGRDAAFFVEEFDNTKTDLSQMIDTVFALTRSLLTYNDYIMARTTLLGMPVGTVVLNVQQIAESAVEILTLLGAKKGDGSAFNLNLDTVFVDTDTSLAAKFASVEAAQGDISAQVATLMQATVDSEGHALAKFLLAVNAAGRIAGMAATNDGELATLDFEFDLVNFFLPDGSRAMTVGADDDGPVVDAPRMKVGKFYVDSIETDAIAQFAINKPYSTELISSVNLPQNQATQTIATLTITKDLADSDVIVEWYMRMRPGGAYAGHWTLSRTIGGSTVQIDDVWFWQEAANLGGFISVRTVEPYKRRFYGVPAGTVTYTLKMTHYADSTSVTPILEAGSGLFVSEVKRL